MLGLSNGYGAKPGGGSGGQLDERRVERRRDMGIGGGGGGDAGGKGASYTYEPELDPEAGSRAEWLFMGVGVVGAGMVNDANSCGGGIISASPSASCASRSSPLHC